jgi:hypothetical protein
MFVLQVGREPTSRAQLDRARQHVVLLGELVLARLAQ